MKLYMKGNNKARIELESMDECSTIHLALKYYVENMQERGLAGQMYENAVNAQQAIDPVNAVWEEERPVQ